MKRTIKKILVMCMVTSLLCSCGNSQSGSDSAGDNGRIIIIPDTPSPDNGICDACGGSGRSSIKCTYCGGSGIDPAYEATKGSAIHSFADKECAKCGGTGLERCTECWGTGEK